MAKARGFSSSRMSLSVSQDVAQKAWPLVSYTSSTDLNSPEPQGTGLLSRLESLVFTFLTPQLCDIYSIPFCNTYVKGVYFWHVKMVYLPYGKATQQTYNSTIHPTRQR